MHQHLLRLAVDERPEGVVLSATGALTASSSAELRTALYKCLVEGPNAVVVDLTEATVVDPVALAILPAVARQASLWPGVPFAVAIPPGPVAHRIDQLGYHRWFSVRNTAAAALDAVGDRAAAPTVSELLPPISGAARHARTMITEACLRWDIGHLIGPACIVVTELVTNAVQHAGTAMTVRLCRRGRYLLMAVEDGSVGPPRAQPMPGPDDPTSGRGLALVKLTALHWGSLPTGAGKVVWAVLRV